MAIPAAMGMIFTTLYNLTDFWFAGKLSDDALAGVSIAGSVFMLILSGSIGMQTGTTAMVASEVGRGNTCLLYTSPSPRDRTRSRMPSSA